MLNVNYRLFHKTPHRITADIKVMGMSSRHYKVPPSALVRGHGCRNICVPDAVLTTCQNLTSAFPLFLSTLHWNSWSILDSHASYIKMPFW